MIKCSKWVVYVNTYAIHVYPCACILMHVSIVMLFVSRDIVGLVSCAILHIKTSNDHRVEWFYYYFDFLLKDEAKSFSFRILVIR